LKLKREQPKHKQPQWQNHTPPETKANQTKRQAQPKMPTPLEDENTRFYQLSSDKPQAKLRPLEQQVKSNPF
jgi:hypothetical protein